MKTDAKFSACRKYRYALWRNWDGTDKDLRSTYPFDLENHRLLQYESCRGLEAWSVVCLALDDFVEHKIKYFKDEEIEQSFSFIQDKEENKRKHAYQWSLIPLTRPIDTLIITLKNPRSDFSKKLKTLADEHRDFVYWEN
jgi:hypothetical protein